jgi:hypothetical protein
MAAGPLTRCRGLQPFLFNQLRRLHLLGCEYPGEWLWATPRTGLTLLLGEPMVPCK